MDPAPYPPKNTEEIKAIITFLGLLDVDRVKPDSRFLDKVPNLDGSLELVDEQQRPVCELKVQIKKIPAGLLKFDCPIELVGYSTRVSSPFILVCVDVENKKAYWCHISVLMSGLKPEQKTFTVKFQPVVDEIGEGFPYFGRWRNLCQTYLESVSQYPRYKQIVDEEIGLTKLSSEDRRIFQQFIDEVNLLLDVDVPIVKYENFADAWKLGVSIHQADQDAVSYSIYTVPKGENAPILTHVPRNEGPPKISRVGGGEISGLVSFHLEGGAGNEVSLQWKQRAYFDDPIKAAREFVFHYLNKLLRNRTLHVYGLNQSVEVLMSFMSEYAHTLGLPETDTYKTADLSYGLNVFFPMWYSQAFPKMMFFLQKNYAPMLRLNPWPSFELIANIAQRPQHPTEAEIRKAIASRLRPAPAPVRTDSFSIETLLQALNFLRTANVEEISRQDRPPSLAGRWTWKCYTPEDFKHNVVSMLRGAANDYADFVKGNRFGRLDSPLISGETALVFAANTSKWQDEPFGLQVDGYWVENTDRSLPLFTFIDLSVEPEACHREGSLVIIRGVRRNWTHCWSSIDDHFREECRTRAMLYELLQVDLERRFGEGFLS